MRFCRFTNFFSWCILSTVIPTTWIAFPFYPQTKRAAHLCGSLCHAVQKRPPSWPVTSTVPRTWWMPPSDRSNTYPLSNLIQTLGGKEAWNFLRSPNGYGSVKKMPGKRRRPYAVRKTVGWHVNPETGKSVQEQLTIGYAATRAEGCKYWQSTTTIPLTSRHFVSNRKILWSIISEFCPLGFWYVNVL